ncbi:hypothetical protein LTS07_008318 [Exophiala sideris]|nr:hypothetical protein LTS07_008318 [Exophiala sideris]KAK5179859.1 hypothetical protein LTR44_007675 [Eurotiomycetes sp. CCFEE 6388]
MPRKNSLDFNFRAIAIVMGRRSPYRPYLSIRSLHQPRFEMAVNGLLALSVFHGAACKTCRRRGRKCTRELPKCSTCLTKGIECEGYALKWSGLASRGKLAGKSSMSAASEARSDRDRAVSPHASVATHEDPTGVTLQQTSTAEDAGILEPPAQHTDTLYGLSNQGWSATASASIDPAIVDVNATSSTPYEIESPIAEDHAAATWDVTMTSSLVPHNIPFQLKFLLDYHFFEVAPRLCIDNATMRNPYTQYILPLAVQDPALLYACAALAACHFNVRLKNASFHVQSLRFKGKAMRRLQEQLWAEQNALDESKLATILMLTLTDLCLGGYSNFDAHFTAARKLIDLRGSRKTPDAFVEQYIAWLDIMSAASTTRKPKFSSNDISLLRGHSSEWSYDVFPCPPDQFEIVAALVDLHRSLDDPRDPSLEDLTKVYDLKHKVLFLPMHTERGESWLHVTEAYRHAIVLYMVRLFDLASDEDEISWLTQSVFHHSKSTPASTGWADNILWPLFHAGLEFRDERRRLWLRERAGLMQRSGGFRNVGTVMSTLERVWATEERLDYLSLLTSEGLGSMVPV